MLNQDDSFTELNNYIEILDSFLTETANSGAKQLTTFDGLTISELTEGNFGDAFTQLIIQDIDINCLTLPEPMTNEEGNCTNLSCKSFEEYLEQQSKRQDLEDQWKIQKTYIYETNKRKVLYIEKHSGPEQMFSYYGVKLSVRLMNYERSTGQILLLPYEELTAKCLSSLLPKNDGLVLFLLKKLQRRSQKLEREEQKIHCFKCRNLFLSKNYTWIYMYKKPKRVNLKEQSEFKLNRMIKQTIEKAIKHKSTSVVIPDFQWPRITQQQKSSLIFGAITNNIHRLVRQRHIFLKQINLSCKNQQNYFGLATELRNISDQFIKNGGVAI